MSKITDTGMSRSEALIMDYLWAEGTGKCSLSSWRI